MAINLDKLVGFHQSALSIRTDRMEVIAGNLANANTPVTKPKTLILIKQWNPPCNGRKAHVP